MANSNPIDVEKSLRGIDFPADKQAILNKAKENGAGDTEISALEGLPERNYDDPTEVAEALVGDTEDDEEKNIEIMDEEPGQ